LVKVGGASRTLLGFPPWLLRIAELAYLPSGNDVHLESLHASLKKFAVTEQRCGS
jgi:hypothetical protein